MDIIRRICFNPVLRLTRFAAAARHRHCCSVPAYAAVAHRRPHAASRSYVWFCVVAVSACGRLHRIRHDRPGRPTSSSSAVATRFNQCASRRLRHARSRKAHACGSRPAHSIEKRDFAPAWIKDGAPRPQMDALIAALHAADREGLDPELYGVSCSSSAARKPVAGSSRSKGFEPEAAATMDTWLTYLYLQVRVGPRRRRLRSGARRSGVADHAGTASTPVDHLERALRDNRVAESLAELTPDGPGVPARCARRLPNIAPSPPRAAGRKCRRIEAQAGPDVAAVARARAAGWRRPAMRRNRGADGARRLRYPHCRTRSNGSSAGTG